VAGAGSTWADQTLSALRAAGYRAGGARSAVVELLERQDCCLSAQEIYDALRAEKRPVGLASVYRIVDLLAGLKLVQRVDVGDKVARYQAARPGGEHHHHVVCDDCGKVEPFSDPRLERVLSDVGKRVGFAIAGHNVLLRGSCGCSG
jgi:Fur family ferric uptake transcriptional regulator